MLHTLIPQSERSALLREYRIRALVVLCFTLCLAGLVGIAALFPSFMRASAAADEDEANLAELQERTDQSGTGSVSAELSADSALVAALSEPAGSVRFSSLIEGIDLARGDVSITSFALSEEATGTFAVTLGGTAPTRQDLLDFESRLEGLGAGNKVDLPISELGASVDVPFSLEVTGPIISSQP